MLSASMGAQHTMPASNLRQDSGASSVREHPPAALSQSTSRPAPGDDEDDEDATKRSGRDGTL
jgi:hypothetical protein